MAIGPDPGLGLEGEDGGGGVEDDDEEVDAVDADDEDDDTDSCSASFSGSGLWSLSSDLSCSFSGVSSGSGFFEFTHLGAARAGLYLNKRGSCE